MKAIIITGNTYPHKREIKYNCSGKWDRDSKGWICPDSQIEQIKTIYERNK